MLQFSTKTCTNFCLFAINANAINVRKMLQNFVKLFHVSFIMHHVELGIKVTYVQCRHREILEHFLPIATTN
jgi:hypothetical protein